MSIVVVVEVEFFKDLMTTNAFNVFCCQVTSLCMLAFEGSTQFKMLCRSIGDISPFTKFLSGSSKGMGLKKKMT
jgi:hypothetical protein